MITQNLGLICFYVGLSGLFNVNGKLRVFLCFLCLFICFNLACTLVYKNHCGNNFGNSFNERSLQYKSVMKIKHQILIGYLLSHLPMKNCQMLFILKHFDPSIFKLFSDLLSRILFAIYIFLSSVFLSLFLAILL